MRDDGGHNHTKSLVKSTNIGMQLTIPSHTRKRAKPSYVCTFYFYFFIFFYKAYLNPRPPLTQEKKKKRHKSPESGPLFYRLPLSIFVVLTYCMQDGAEESIQTNRY